GARRQVAAAGRVRHLRRAGSGAGGAQAGDAGHSDRPAHRGPEEVRDRLLRRNLIDSRPGRARLRARSMPDPERSNPALEATILSASQPSSPSAQAATPTSEGLTGARLRHFDVKGLVGRGGMGAVYLGWDTSLERPVALKVLDAEIGRDPDLLARFVREARAQAR